MFVVTVEFELVPERRAEFLPLMIENAEASKAREPGCRHFDVCIDPERPDLIFLYELYTDRAAFDAHLATDHFKRFDEVTRSLVARKAVRFWHLAGGTQPDHR